MSDDTKVKMPEDYLKQMAQLHLERRGQYGFNYLHTGTALYYLTQEKGLSLETPDDFNRAGLLEQIMSKLSRYVENFHNGGHRDSLIDLPVYAAMLLYTDDLIAARQMPYDAPLFEDDNKAPPARQEAPSDAEKLPLAPRLTPMSPGAIERILAGKQ